MSHESVIMPDGSEFRFWDDLTDYTKVYHVAQKHFDADDTNPGTEDLPFATISRAAEVLQPAEKVIVHAGVYREWVTPARGGEGNSRMIAYEAAAGQDVCLKGSEVIATKFAPSCGWCDIEPTKGRPKVWMVDLAEEWFVGYNPFSARNIFPHYLSFINDWTPAETNRLLLRRGLVFADGRRLRQVNWPRKLTETQGAFWVEEPGLRIHLRLWDDADPNEVTVEVSARAQVFAPRTPHLGYIRLSGFSFAHAADCFPVPQRAMVSSYRGNHWIIEDCRLFHANAVGVDLGKEDWGASSYEPRGGHIVRRNTISDCGVCGIAGPGCVDDTLVEDNVIERIGWSDVERIWECAGLKFHEAQNVLIRRNIFRHITNASGAWLDCLNRNCRITRNVFADIVTTLGACYHEKSHDGPNLIDGNLFWDIRNARRTTRTEAEIPVRGGVACLIDCCESVTVAHNFFGRVSDHFAVSMHLEQSDRILSGRSGLCRRQKVLNNVFFDCPRQIILGRTEENISDGNLFDAKHNSACFRIDFPPPQTHQNLQGWREFFRFDLHSSSARIEADFDPDTLRFTWKIDGELPTCQEVPELHGTGDYAYPGPLSPVQCKQINADKGIRVSFPLGHA